MFKSIFVSGILLASSINGTDLNWKRPIFERCISGDNFRILADFILESNHPCDIEFHRSTLIPKMVKPGDIVFVENSCLDIFFHYYFPFITNPFILVSHNHDTSAPREFAPYLEDEKLIQWFGFNPTIDHPKFVGVPLGLSNRDWPHSANHEIWIEEVLRERQAQNQTDRKTIFLYANFSVHTAPKIRKPVFDYFQSIQNTELGHRMTWASNLSFKDFARDVANSEFIISPQGSGMDCHRLWEALYLGCIPVVVDSSLTTLYSDFPVITVSKWEDVSIELLLTKKEEFKNRKFPIEKLYFDYWKDRILSLKRSIQEQYSLLQ